MTAHAVVEQRAALVTLAGALAGAPAGQEVAPGFTAWLQGEPYEVTAVLERTAVLDPTGDRWAERRTARLDQLLIDPASIRWRSKPAPRPRLGIAKRSDVADERAEPEQVHAPVAAEPAPAPVAEKPDADQDQVADEPGAGARRRDCGRCGVELPTRNQRGLCLRCQRRCPICGGTKSIPAPQCRRCRRGPEAAAEPASPTVAGRALDQLPAQIQEVLDRVVVLARYARALEDEVDHYRAELRELQERITGALGRPGA